MQELQLNESTRSKRKKWAWTYRNLKRSEDIERLTAELKEWWPVGVRQIYYRLISTNLVKADHWQQKGKRVNIYKALGRTIKWMRIDEKLSWEAITDEFRITTPKVGFTNVETFIKAHRDYFLTRYARCSAQKQDKYIEVWIEKAGLLHIVKPIADYFCRRVVCCRGYNSVTFQSEFYNRAIEAINLGQDPIVLYFGDWDPSGENMIYAAMQTLKDELDLDEVEYYRAGINPEHFEMIPADPVPLKPGDSRTKLFIEKYGPTAYELDAFHPKQLQELVTEALIKFTDLPEFNENKDQQEEDRKVITDFRNECVKYITEKAHYHGLL